jgi:uncharacterized protein YjhX (UPF0386 family)
VNISKHEQRVLHALAQGGRIVHRRDPHTGKVVEVDCFTREGWRLADCRLGVFARLKRRQFIASQNGQPYRISRQGLAAVRAQLDNRSRRWRPAPARPPLPTPMVGDEG